MPRRRPRARSFARWACLLFATPLFVAISPLSAQQQFGRWWWDGRIGWRDRSNVTELAGEPGRDYSEQELRLELGLNGFLGHPALGRFRIGVERSAVDVGGGAGIPSDGLGYGAELELLPRGPMPLSLGYRRGRFDYQPATAASPLSLRSLIDESESWRGRLDVRRGPLAGLLVGADLARATFVDASLRDELDDRLFAQWSRRIGKFDQTLRIDRDERQFGQFDFDTGLWTATFDQRGVFGPDWQWQLGAAALRTETRFERQPTQRLDDLRLRQSMQHTVRTRDLLDVRAELSQTEPSQGERSSAARLGFAYRWRPRPAIEVAPFVQTGELAAGDAEERFTRGGLELSWHREARLDLYLSGRASYAATTRSGFDQPGDDDLALSGTFSLGAGEPARLRGEVEAELARNELRLDRSAGGLPALESALLAAAIGAEDFARLRLRLHHQGARSRLAGWVEARSGRSETLAGIETERESLSATLEAAYGKLSLVTNLGQTSVSLAGEKGQSADFAAAALDWRLLRFLSLRLSYRAEVRSIAALPDLDRRRAEASASFRLGLLDLRAELFEEREELGRGGERRGRGLFLSVSRDFAGWLPIVTGTRRRGQIR